jgi:hypothetical protein
MSFQNNNKYSQRPFGENTASDSATDGAPPPTIELVSSLKAAYEGAKKLLIVPELRGLATTERCSS